MKRSGAMYCYVTALGIVIVVVIISIFGLWP